MFDIKEAGEISREETMVLMKNSHFSPISADPCVIPRILLVKIDFIVLSCSLGVQPTGSDRVQFFRCRFPPFLAQFQDGGRRTGLAQLTLFLWEISQIFFPIWVFHTLATRKRLC